jgi:hypothetical protein
MSLSRIDHDALRLAIEVARQESPGRAAQIDSKLRDEPMVEVGEFCAYVTQGNALRLEPWECPPCWIDDIEAALRGPDGTKKIRQAALLLRRMQRCGVSKFHPDPVAACEAAERSTSPGKPPTPHDV